MTLMIDRPFQGLEQWVGYFQDVEIPVLRHTAQQLAVLREDKDDVDVRQLARLAFHDPLLILRIYLFNAKSRTRRQVTDITAIEGALMMVGVSRFFDEFAEVPIVETQLRAHPKALVALLKVVARARHASLWAQDWAVLRRDLEAEELTLAALLHDFAEMLMWCFAPTLAMRVLDRQAADSRLRSVSVQEEEYGVPLFRIKLALAERWSLPPLLIALMNPESAASPRVRNVKLAVDLARHSATGWTNAALEDDFKAIEALLHIPRKTLLEKIGVPPAVQPYPHSHS
jgi:HD-like signal output (HDOD) protein